MRLQGLVRSLLQEMLPEKELRQERAKRGSLEEWGKLQLSALDSGWQAGPRRVTGTAKQTAG